MTACHLSTILPETYIVSWWLLSFPLSAIRCQQPKHYCQSIVFPGFPFIHPWIPPLIQLHSTTCCHTLSHRCDVGRWISTLAFVSEWSRRLSPPKRWLWIWRMCWPQRKRKRRRRSMMLVNGPRASPRVSMSTRSAELIFASSLNSTSRFPQDVVSSALQDPPHAERRSEAKPIEMVYSLPSPALCGTKRTFPRWSWRRRSGWYIGQVLWESKSGGTGGGW